MRNFRINAKLSGMQPTINRMQLELMGVQRRTYQGMYAAVKHLELQMDTVNPVVPYSNEEHVHMRETWLISGSKNPAAPTIAAGYTAWYAPIIHEGIINGTPVKNWTRPGSGPKWLQIHFSRNIEEMKLIVASYATPIGKPKGSLNYGGLGVSSIWSRPIEERQGNEKGTFDL